MIFKEKVSIDLNKARKLHYRTVFQGMKISIENRKGSYRSGIDSDGKPWKTKLWFPYGYLIGAVGNDKDNLDCFVGVNKDSKKAYVIHQKNIKTGKYDEDKVMLGWLTQTQAIKDYLKNYNRSDMFMGCTPMSMDDFKVKGFTKKPGMIKAHIKMYTRRSKSGKLSTVREHEDSRSKKKKQVGRSDIVYDIGQKVLIKIAPIVYYGNKLVKQKRDELKKERDELKGFLFEGEENFDLYNSLKPKTNIGIENWWGTGEGTLSQAQEDIDISGLEGEDFDGNKFDEEEVQGEIDDSFDKKLDNLHEKLKELKNDKESIQFYELKGKWLKAINIKPKTVHRFEEDKENIYDLYTIGDYEFHSPREDVEYDDDLKIISKISNKVIREIPNNIRNLTLNQINDKIKRAVSILGNKIVSNTIKRQKLSKSQIKAHTRRSKKTGKIVHVREHTDIRSKKGRKPKRSDIIYDVGSKIGGAKKDLYLNLWKRRITKAELALMEKDHVSVVKSVVKGNVLVPLAAEDAMGRMDAGAYYMYAAIKRRISVSPPDDPEARMDYIMAANRLNQVARKAKTADDFFGYLAEEASWLSHNNEARQQDINKSVKKLIMGDYRKKIYDQIKIFEKKGIDNLSKHELGIMQKLAIIVRNVKIYQEGGGYRLLKPKTLKQAFAQAIFDEKRHLIIKKVGKIKIGDSMSFNNKNDAWLKFLHAAYHTRGWRLEGTDKNAISGIRVRSSSASSRTLQRGYLSAKWEDFTKKKAGGKKGGFKRDVPEKVVRTGGVKIKVTKPEDFMKEFGMRGIEFGNWIDVSHGNYHIQRCGEAFYDLADVLKLNKKHMSINKRLAIAFGARGSGSASAHYEPLSETINLTKWNGGGSVAHEWFHFFDNVMSKNQAKGLGIYGSEGKSVGAPIQAAYNAVIDSMYKTKEHMITVKEVAKYKQIRSSYAGISEWKRKHPRSPLKAFNGMVKDLQASRYNRWINNPKNVKKIAGAIAYTYKQDFDYIRKEVTTATTFSIDSAELGKDYWGSGREMFARAAESWVEDELAEAKRRNTYLVSGTKTSIYVKITDGVAKEINPYPKGKEREVINRAFRKLFVEVGKNKSLLKSIMSMFIRMGK